MKAIGSPTRGRRNGGMFPRKSYFLLIPIRLHVFFSLNLCREHILLGCCTFVLKAFSAPSLEVPDSFEYRAVEQGENLLVSISRCRNSSAFSGGIRRLTYSISCTTISNKPLKLRCSPKCRLSVVSNHSARSTDAKAAWDHCPMLVVFLRILNENELDALRRKTRISEERSKGTRGVLVLRTGCSKNADRIVVA